MTLNYFLLENPKAKGKFMPNTKPAYNYSAKEFLSRINRKNPLLSINTIKDVLQAMTDTTEAILSEGSAITIPYFMRIAPAVKGVFNSHTEGFNASKHRIGINCIVLPSFTEKIMKNVKVEKIKTPMKRPRILQIVDNKTKGNAIQKNFANRLKGADLFLKKLEFTGFTIICNSSNDKSIVMEKDQFEIISHTNREIVFTFSRDFVSPDWLVNDTEISIKLRYKTAKGMTMENNIYSTIWKC